MRHGHLQLSSDNISALLLLRDTILREGTQSKQRVSVDLNLTITSVKSIFCAVWPQLQKQRMFANRIKLLEALQELQAQDGDISYMEMEHRQVLQSGDDIQMQSQRASIQFEYLSQLLKNIFIDWCKYSGVSAYSSKVNQLDHIIQMPHSQVNDLLEHVASVA
eukprot:TRINITY_DN18674_c0_g1_i1.p2 TRINITY_DN18674_c0_g1~~TRINITY_DN18674_c0_g1_i1.p2  ORF type:complete len:179 (+),score=0.40 TRINITY_DN18674_c0_g1_i1:51-539(+)